MNHTAVYCGSLCDGDEEVSVLAGQKLDILKACSELLTCCDNQTLVIRIFYCQK
jgi:hypothetical protein